MSLLQNVREYFKKSTLKKELQKRGNFIKKKVNIQSAKSIGILFDATSLDRRQAILQYADRLKKQRKKVFLLGYFDVKQSDGASHDFKFFDKKSINWMQAPKGDAVDFFLQQNFDIFVFLNPTTTTYSEYIAALTKANLKVGPISTEMEAYDLMLSVKNQTSIKDFIQHMEAILKKTNKEHEAA